MSETAPLLPQHHHEAESAHLASVRRVRSTVMGNLFWRVGALLGAAAVGMAAFGAHGLHEHVSDPKKVASWNTAAQFQLIHSVLLLVSSSVGPAGNPLSGFLLTVGMLLFSGSIYALVWDGAQSFIGETARNIVVQLTPIGGVFLLGGWIVLLARGRPGYPARIYY